MTKSQSRELLALIERWLAEEPDFPAGEQPVTDASAQTALRLLEVIRDASDMLDAWSDRLVRVAHERGADNTAIGAALGVGKEAIRRRLLKEPGAA